jgi:hypothetical protein
MVKKREGVCEKPPRRQRLQSGRPPAAAAPRVRCLAPTRVVPSEGDTYKRHELQRECMLT